MTMHQRFVASYSGGKDSMLAIHRAVAEGLVLSGLLITYNTDRNRSWFHGIPQSVLDRVSRSLGAPVQLIKTTGEQYAEQFGQALKREQKLGADCCVFGDIDIQGHFDWCTARANEAGLLARFPLWNESREALVRESIRLGYKATITVVDTKRLPISLLGRTLSEEVLREIAENGADLCGENGEYHTFVSDGPLFANPVEFTLGETCMEGDYGVKPIL